jgi:hypothetical protein
MSFPRKQSEAVTRRYGRRLTNREIAEAVRRTPPLRRRMTSLTQLRATQPDAPATIVHATAA